MAALIGAVAGVGCGVSANKSSESGEAAGVVGQTFTVTIQNGQGQKTNPATGKIPLKIEGGYITSSPAGISCRVSAAGDLTACSFDFALGTPVVLTATPHGDNGSPDPATRKNSLFLGWAGDCSGESSACTLPGTSSEKYIVAVFGFERTFHANYTDPTVHGPKYSAFVDEAPGSLQCTSCHGANLQGQGIAVGCSTCHSCGAGPFVGGAFGCGTVAPARLAVSSEIVLGGALSWGNASEPAAAWGNGEFLVVWEEQGPGGYDILGSRMTADGELIDPIPFVISDAPGDQRGPGVASDGTNFYVAWTDGRAGDHRIYGSLVYSDGAVADRAGALIAVSVNGAGPVRAPGLAFDGTRYLLAWSQFAVNSPGQYTRIRGARVDRSGAVLGPDFDIGPQLPGWQIQPQVACGAGGCLVAWSDSRNARRSGEWGSDNGYDIYGARVNSVSTGIDGAEIAISMAKYNQTSPKMALVNGNYVVAWNDFRNCVAPDPVRPGECLSGSSSIDCYGVIVGPSGTFASPEFGIGTEDSHQLRRPLRPVAHSL